MTIRVCLLCEATSAGTAVRFRHSTSQICLWCEGELARTARAWCTYGRHAVAVQAMTPARPNCRACIRQRRHGKDNAAARGKAWRTKNPERARAYDAGRREQRRAYDHAAYWRNPERARAKARVRNRRRTASRRPWARAYYHKHRARFLVDLRRRYVARKLAILRGWR